MILAIKKIPSRMVLVGVMRIMGLVSRSMERYWGYFSRREDMACWCSGPS